MRKTREELNEIKKKYGVDTLWSWSRLSSYNQSPFEYYLKYIVYPRVKEDRADSIYTYAGSLAHTIMEDLHEGKIKHEDMTERFDDDWFTLTLSNYKFDRNDEIKNQNIQEKYLLNLQHFFKHHKLMGDNVAIEKYIIIKIGNHIFNGYIDAVHKDEDGNYIVTDFKTSTIYTGKKIDKEQNQLVLYSEGLRQMGIPPNKIKARWNFLKYCTVETQLANGKTNERNIERCKIGESLASNARMWLKKLGHEDEVDGYIDLLQQTNSVECLPEDVQKKYKFDDCYVYVLLNEDVINALKVDILDTIHEIQTKEIEYQKTQDDKLFWDDMENVAKDSFYFSTLCSYSGKLHKPYGEYLEQLESKKNNKDNLFDGVGSKNKNENEIAEDDLSWLEMI